MTSKEDGGGIKVDTHEPTRAYQLMQQAIPCSVGNINDQGWADYLWMDYDGIDVHWERKQWGELVSGLDSVEVQLREEKARHPDARLGLIVEGVAEPSFLGTQLYRRGDARKKGMYYADREQTTRYSQIQAWLYQVGKHMEVMHTHSLEGTVQALVAMYNSDQKSDHLTFRRHLRPIHWNPNPQVEMLMSIGRNAGIGEAKAKEIIAQYGTVWNVMSSTPEVLAQNKGVGMHLATRLLRKIGRTDV